MARDMVYDPKHWSFLTGPADKIGELASLSNVKFEPAGGFINHNFRTLIINAAGTVQMTFPIGGNLSDMIVAEMLKASSATNMPPVATNGSTHEESQPVGGSLSSKRSVSGD